MSMTFVGTLDRTAIDTAAVLVAELVATPVVGRAWADESVLAGMTVGGLARHLTSQTECAVDFLRLPVPTGAPVVDLLGFFAGADWYTAAVDAAENTSIRDEFNEMAGIGPAATAALAADAAADLPSVLRAAGPQTFVPWQQCVLPTDDFLVCRLVEIVVHADDLANSVDVPTPDFGAAATEPVVQALAVLAARRHGPDRVVRALARAERSVDRVSAFG